MWADKRELKRRKNVTNLEVYILMSLPKLFCGSHTWTEDKTVTVIQVAEIKMFKTR
jgi:hypothetical protein